MNNDVSPKGMAGKIPVYCAFDKIEPVEDLIPNPKNPNQHPEDQVELLGEQEKTCAAAWAQIALNERGDVIYCCHKPYQTVGHILDENILELKNAAKTDMRTCDIPCRLTTPNKFVAAAEAERKDSFFI